MSLTGALNAAISGLGANQKQMQVISGNVSNAGVEGYTRKIAPQETNLVGTSTNGGVEVNEVQRRVDEFLRTRIRDAESELSFDKTKQEYFKRVQDFFGTLDSNSNLSNSIDELRQSVEDLSINPENAAAQADVVRKAQEVTGQFRQFSQQTQDLRAEADLQIKNAVTAINENLREIKDLNTQIAQAEGAGKSSAELRDKRDVALKELSQHMDVSTFERNTGELVVVTDDSNARQLVDGTAAELTFDASGSLGSGENGGPVEYADGTNVDADSIGGRLGALLQMRDQDLANFQADLDRLAAQMREEVNAAHNLATPGNEATLGSDTITGTHRFDQDNSDGTQGDTPITDINGSFEIVRVNSNGEVQNAVNIDLDAIKSGPGVPTDVQGLVDRMNQYARGSPPFGSANSGKTANQDIFSVTGEGKVRMQSPDAGGTDFVLRQNPEKPATISSGSLSLISDDDGDGKGTRNVSHFFGFNNMLETSDANARDAAGNTLPQEQNNPNLVTGDTSSSPSANDAKTGPGVSAASVIQVNEDIANDPSKLGRIAPKADTGEDPLPIGNGEVGQKLAEAFDQKVNFAGPKKFQDPATNLTKNATGGNVGSREVTLAGFAGDVLQFQASRTAELEQTVQAKEGVKEQLAKRANAQSGVNIDQELANLTTYQQAFNANARVISVVDELFTTLNQMAR